MKQNHNQVNFDEDVLIFDDPVGKMKINNNVNSTLFYKKIDELLHFDDIKDIQAQ